MPRSYSDPGSVTTLCACGNRMGLRAGSCGSCWALLPLAMRDAWARARNTPAAAAARDEIRDYLRSVKT